MWLHHIILISNMHILEIIDIIASFEINTLFWIKLNPNIKHLSN